MIKVLLAAAITTAIPSTAKVGSPVYPEARPALWVVNDHDTIIYLFGTFHALDGRSVWFRSAVETAFTESDELVLETVIPDFAGLPQPRPEADSAEDHARPVAHVGPVAGSASFLNSSKMVMSAGQSRGMSTEKGADAVLRRAAEAAGKPVGGLESLDFQLRLFSSLPSAVKPSAPSEARAVNAALADALGRLQEAWNRGDVESFAPMLDQMRVATPETYRLLFADRNARWAEWIAQRLQQPGTVFVAVGAGHLAGQDSVQHKLAAVGIRSARIN